MLHILNTILCLNYTLEKQGGEKVVIFCEMMCMKTFNEK